MTKLKILMVLLLVAIAFSGEAQVRRRSMIRGQPGNADAFYYQWYGALSFNGSNYASSTNGPGTPPTQPWTFEVSFRVSDSSCATQFLAGQVGSWTNAASKGWMVTTLGSTGVAFWANGSLYGIAGTSSNLFDGAWHHWGYTKVPFGNCFFWLDGIKTSVGSVGAPTITIVSSNIFIGGFSNEVTTAGITNFLGSISMMGLSAMARYSYTPFPSPFCGWSDAGSKFLYVFQEGTGTSVADQTASHYDLTLKGNPLPTWVNGRCNFNCGKCNAGQPKVVISNSAGDGYAGCNHPSYLDVDGTYGGSEGDELFYCNATGYHWFLGVNYGQLDITYTATPGLYTVKTYNSMAGCGDTYNNVALTCNKGVFCGTHNLGPGAYGETCTITFATPCS
jgi:hypothetical protein